MRDYCNRYLSPTEYLDELVILHNQMKSLECYDENIRICGFHDYIQIHNGIVDFAKATNSEVMISPFECSEGKFLEFHFEYKGVKFMELGTIKNWEERKIVSML